MNDKPKRHEMTLKPVLFGLAGTKTVETQLDIPYSEDQPEYRCFDLYRPQSAPASEALPAVVFVTGYRDPGADTFIGCKLKEIQSYIDWAKLAAASGIVAITYSNVEPEDVDTLLAHLREHAGELGIDAKRIALWACSGNVPVALSLLMEPGRFRCAVLCYGFMFDDENGTVAEQAKTIGFSYPISNNAVDDLAGDTPLLVARAGKDAEPLNASIDRFVDAALRRNLDFSLVNHAEGPHAFDLLHDSSRTREIIAQILAFLSCQLLEPDES